VAAPGTSPAGAFGELPLASADAVGADPEASDAATTGTPGAQDWHGAFERLPLTESGTNAPAAPGAGDTAGATTGSELSSTVSPVPRTISRQADTSSAGSLPLLANARTETGTSQRAMPGPAPSGSAASHSVSGSGPST